MSNYAKKENAKCQYETMKLHGNVDITVNVFRETTKRNFSKPRESAKDRQIKSKEERSEKRDSLLDGSFVVPNGQADTLQLRKKARISIAVL